MENIFFICLSGIIIVAVVGVFKGKILSKHYFLCKHCGRKFKLKWTKLIFEVHAFNEFKVECPYCKIKDFCEDIGKEKS